MKKAFKILIIGGLITALVGCGMTVFKTYEEPDYKVLSSESSKPLIEQRSYRSKLIAEVQVSGSRDESINKGFRLLADFIFGNNTTEGSIEMTAPVAQQAVSEKVEMTTPVAQQAVGKDLWHVRFYMPKEYTMESLPKPNNDKVTIRYLDGYDAIAIRFSGRHSESNLQEHLQKLEAFVVAQGLKTQGEPTYAFFDPPWTPWLMKRNEIIYRVKGQEKK